MSKFPNITQTLSEKNKVFVPTEEMWCVCCLTNEGLFMSLNECKHADFLRTFFKYQMEHGKHLVCQLCHTMLKKIDLFKQRVEDSVLILSKQANHSDQVCFLHNLKINKSIITVDISPEHMNNNEYKIKDEGEVIEGTIDYKSIDNRTEKHKSIENRSAKAKIEKFKLENTDFKRDNKGVCEFGNEIPCNVIVPENVEAKIKYLIIELKRESPESANDKEHGNDDKLNVDDGKLKMNTSEIINVKIERDFSDIEMSLADIKRQAEDQNDKTVKKKMKQKIIKKTSSRTSPKYEGKIVTVTISNEALMDERELQKRDEDYLRLPYKCEDCIVSFEFEMAWKRHMEKHHDEKKNGYTCGVCSTVFSAELSYKKHCRKHLRRYECSRCGKRFHDEYNAVQHYNELHGVAGSISPLFSCPDCDFVTNSDGSYRYHRSKHRKDNNPCEICGKLFVNTSNRNKHMDTIHKQSTRVFQCEPCGKVYKAKSGLFTHMTTTHGTTDRRAYCADCCTYFKTQQNLVNHLRTHSNHVDTNDNKFICDNCDARFLSKTRLQNHIDWEHRGIRKFKCPKCAKGFRLNTSLTKHLQYVHEKKRPPRDKICNYCGRAFTTQAILNAHIRTHTGERPYSCNHCQANFSHASALYNHNRFRHNPNRIK